ncbi:G-protein coupled receptor 157-like [Saccostrea cucullata]|uniref:G-protein coupled receptor 157-like n=1 Tax=Saccostrea cuccullata TaxID=36930 RepID=UPI002ECFF5D9
MLNTTEAINFQFTKRDEIYSILTVLSSSLSVFGGIGIIAIYLCFRDLRTCGRKLLVYLSLMDALTAFGNILGVVWLLCRAGTTCHSVYESMGFCRLHASLTIFSSISSFIWMIIIGVCLLKSIIWNMPTFARTYMKVFYLIAWPVPGLVAILSLSLDVIGYDKNIASWCWIDPNTPAILFWQFFTGKAWEMTAYLSTIIMYSVVRCFLFKHTNKKSLAKSKKNSRKAALQEANLKLTFVPVVFIVLRVWGTLRFLLGNLAHYDAPWISYLQGVGDSSQGFANFILYCALTDKVRERVFSAICLRHRIQHPEENIRQLKASTVETQLSHNDATRTD